ncbi:FAD-dependent oxidoreductase [Fictibacillus fluitans]|uniref:FAD-binding oxidoreductase n=1 Tax=Fictibacillus fluitans TaxID=3058422 RepID=A0ABT8I2Y3_9BACL|nr:FAD-binding oxidoreductase [Fictibacillus sp. NE201]MDN4527383.1 FAD-binding oxidoreductase [Fictibacillus sp. NE201]
MKKLNLKGLTGEVITRFSPQYEEARQEWNRAVQKFPLVIVYCSTVDDVRNAILWARRNEVRIRIRSGGHHYEGYSVGNGIIVIDISRMDGIVLNNNGQLTIQGGVKNEQLYDFVGSMGYPFPGGTCPTVGVSGYVLGGGWGFSSRYLGLGCDSLIELELVDYTGRVLKANRQLNQDLFWACQGAGGGNFGVVVSMTFALPEPVDNISFVEIYAPKADVKLQEIFLNAWQYWLEDLDERMTANASVYNSLEEGTAIYGRGFFYGPPEEAAKVLEPLLINGKIQLFVRYLPFLEAVRAVEATYPEYERFKSTGRFVYRKFSGREIRNLVGLVQKRAEGSIFTGLTVYALGGKVSDVNPFETAFFYRQADYILGIQTIWEDPGFEPENLQWMKKRFPYVKSITKGSFVNFPYSPLRHYEKAYFGWNAPRLKKINKKYDPYNVFSFPQGINRSPR